MPIFVYSEQSQNTFTTQSIEAISFSKHLANLKNTDLVAICINAKNTHILQKYGVNKVINIKSETLKVFNAQSYAEALAQNTDEIIIFPHTSENSAVAASLSILKDSFLITQAISFPEKIIPFSIKKKSFSGKVIMNITTEKTNIILTLSPHSFNIQENFSDTFQEVEIKTEVENPFKIINIENEETKKKDLTTSDIVVCAGRGLQAPKNWEMIEELADVLGGATACTRPISDMGWRDYNEHAGQTGKNIAPKLYIGIGISGAIQHIAGINASQCIVVINNDPEAEFFKYADYGIVGDAFEIVPNLIEKIKSFSKS